MAKKPYDEVSVIRELSKKSACVVEGKTIKALKHSPDLGNSTWGKIDYLCKVHNYTLSIVDSITKRTFKNNSSSNRSNKNDNTNKSNTKKNKLDMANLTRTAMRNVSNK